MNFQKLLKYLKSNMIEFSLNREESRLFLTVHRMKIMNILEVFKRSGFRYLTAVNCVETSGKLNLQYYIKSEEYGLDAVIDIILAGSYPEVLSAAGMFKNAVSFELYISEMFGISFLGNELNEKRKMMKNYSGIPVLKKEFNLQDYQKKFKSNVSTKHR